MSSLFSSLSLFLSTFDPDVTVCYPSGVAIAGGLVCLGMKNIVLTKHTDAQWGLEEKVDGTPPKDEEVGSPRLSGEEKV